MAEIYSPLRYLSNFPLIFFFFCMFSFRSRTSKVIPSLTLASNNIFSSYLAVTMLTDVTLSPFNLSLNYHILSIFNYPDTYASVSVSLTQVKNANMRLSMNRAQHSNSWLLGVAFYFGGHFGFGKIERKRLFQMINDFPTIFEVVTGTGKPPKELSATHNNSSKSKLSGKMSRQSEAHTKEVKMSPPNKEEDDSGEEEEDDEQGAICVACGDNYGTNEFWICCDIYERWFHGKCVKIMPAKAEHIKRYKCPSCSNKRAKHKRVLTFVMVT